MGNLDRLIKLQRPEVINAAEMAYCSNGGQKGKPQTAKRKTTSGGVIRPPTMAKACWRPIIRAKKIGMGSSAETERYC